MSDAPISEQETAAPPPAPDPQPAAADAVTDAAPPAADVSAADDVDVSADAAPSAAFDQAGDRLDEQEIELSELEAQLLEDMDRLQAERNDYLDQLLRTRADFDNYRKRIQKQQSEHLERAAEALVEKLLDALDTFDLAMAHGQGFEQARDRLVTILTKEGLERIDPAGEQFDPKEADAVAHEEGDGGPIVSEVLRPGYRWKGRVLRPAMVKVKG